MHIIAINPHPDDIELSVSGVLLDILKSKSVKVTIVYITDGDVLPVKFDRIKNSISAWKNVCEAPPQFVVLHQKEFNINVRAIVQKLIEIGTSSHKSIFMVPWPNTKHNDHKISSLAASIAASATESKIVYYYDGYGNPETSCDTYIRLCIEYSSVDKKLQLLNAIRAQLFRKDKFTRHDLLQYSARTCGLCGYYELLFLPSQPVIADSKGLLTVLSNGH